MKHLLKYRAQEENGNPIDRLFGLIGRTVESALPPNIQIGRIGSGARVGAIANLSADSAMTLMKVQGSLRDNWSAAVNAPIKINNGPAKRWATANGRQVMTAKTAAPAKRSSTTGNAPAIDEEIRGLDDLFTHPVAASFEEMLPPVPGHESIEPAPASTREELIPASISASAQKASSIGEPPRKQNNGLRFDDSIRKQIRWPLINEKDDMKERAEMKRAGKKALQAVASAADGEGVSDWFDLTEDSAKPVEKSEYVRPKAPDIILQGDIVEEKNVHRYYAPGKEPVRERLKLDDELKEDMSTFDLMVRNNQILSHSIDNLVDRYFYQSSLEEDENLY